MEAEIKCSVLKFNVPSFVYLDTGTSCDEHLKVPVSSVDECTLGALCDQFRRDLFSKAGKKETSLATIQ